MKSDLQAVRIALICFALGCLVSVGRGAAAPGGGGTATVVGEAGAEPAGGDGVTTAGAVSETGAAAAPARRTFWQAAESCAALARKQSRSSGLLGVIHEQCDTKSSSVQACRTAASCSCSDGCDCCGWDAAPAGCGRSDLGAAALIALLHAADNCAALFWRHCSASRPPGCTPEQCDMKSERQACRIVVICSGLGCCATDGYNIGTGDAERTSNASVRALMR